MRKLEIAVLGVALAGMLAGSVSAAGAIEGYVRDQFGSGLHEVRVYLQPQGGGGGAFGFGFTDYYGRYYCAGLQNGTWSAYCSRAWSWRSRVHSGIVVNNNVANGDIPLGADYQVEEWVGSGTYTSFGQTFMALGPDIVEVGVRNDWAESRKYEIRIYDGYGGPQIGPARQTPNIGEGGTGEARWITGDVPVIPGQTYYVEATRFLGTGVGPIVAPENPYPFGMGYINGAPAPGIDVHFIIGSDDDGTVVSYNYPYTGLGSLGTWCNEVGQTFVAKGTSLAGVDMNPTIGWGDYMEADVSILAGGPGGPQIGPTKTFGETGDWGHGWAFEPGEVPLTAGQTYYLKIVRTPPNMGLNYALSELPLYTSGQLYMDGVAQPGEDLTAHILEYNDLPDFSISNIQFSNAWADHVDVTWSSSVAATSQAEYWEVGSTGPHTFTAVDETLVGSHSRTLTGLEAGHSYNVIVKSFRRGYEWQSSAPQVYVFSLPNSGTVSGHVYDDLGAPLEGAVVTVQPFGYSESTDAAGFYEIVSVPAGIYDVTGARVGYQDVTVEDQTVTAGFTTTVDFELDPWPNLIQNYSFETGDMSSWTNFGDAFGIETGTWFGDIEARTGSYFVGRARHGDYPDGGMYQRVACRPGADYEGQIFTHLYHGDNDPDAVRARIGIDPTGGISYVSGTVVWSDWVYPSAPWYSEYVEYTTQRVTASGGYVTLFLQYDCKYSDGWHIIACDDGAVYGPLPYVQSTSPAGWLSAGWNLMSFPLEPANPAVTAALDDVIAAGNDPTNSMYAYDGTYTIYPGDFNTVSRGKAYWLLLTVGAQENLTGDEAFGSADVPLLDGWSFIGHPQGSAVLLADCSVTDGVTTHSFADAVAAGWIDPTVYYYDGSYLVVRTDGTGDDDSLRPWYGYWLLANTAGLELIVP